MCLHPVPEHLFTNTSLPSLHPVTPATSPHAFTPPPPRHSSSMRHHRQAASVLLPLSQQSSSSSLSGNNTLLGFSNLAVSGCSESWLRFAEPWLTIFAPAGLTFSSGGPRLISRWGGCQYYLSWKCRDTSVIQSWPIVRCSFPQHVTAPTASHLSALAASHHGHSPSPVQSSG